MGIENIMLSIGFDNMSSDDPSIDLLCNVYKEKDAKGIKPGTSGLVPCQVLGSIHRHFLAMSSSRTTIRNTEQGSYYFTM